RGLISKSSQTLASRQFHSPTATAEESSETDTFLPPRRRPAPTFSLPTLYCFGNQIHPLSSTFYNWTAFLKIKIFACLVLLLSIGTMPRQAAAQGLFSKLKNDARSQSTKKRK
ncbi:hypothetical protein N9Z11_02620, partial [Mariniblastus sp.]|nr:hypothetical protein [Mariniblastus sp.]